MFNKMSGYGIKPIKSLGQNFLVDKNTINKIITAADITGENLVIEVGPGAGSLTGELAFRAGNLAAVEIDRNLIPLLNDIMKGSDNVEIIHADILKIDIKKDMLDKNPEYN